MNSPVDRSADHGRVDEYGRLIHGGFAPYDDLFSARHSAFYSLSLVDIIPANPSDQQPTGA